MKRSMIRMNGLVIAVLFFGIGDALAARALVAELLARPPAAAGQTAMISLALEACLHRAQELDRIGFKVDSDIAAIDRLAAEGRFLQVQIDAELPMLNSYDEKGLNDFQRRVIRHEELAAKFKSDFPVYQKFQKDYDAALAEFDRDCANNFAAGDRDAAKAKLGIK